MSLRERKRAATKQAIIDAAGTLFAENGYQGTTTKSIAVLAGIATGTLFNYAPTKRDVLVLVWTSKVEALVDAAFTAAEKKSDPVEALVELMRPFFAFYASDRDMGREYLTAIVYAGDDEPDLQGVTDQFIARIAILLAPHCSDAMTAGLNVFATYFTVLTSLLSGRFQTVEQAEVAFKTLTLAQRAGWSAGRMRGRL